MDDMGTLSFCLAACVVTHRIGRNEGVLLLCPMRKAAAEADLRRYGAVPPEMG
jgi:hypothetical protein